MEIKMAFYNLLPGASVKISGIEFELGKPGADDFYPLSQCGDVAIKVKRLTLLKIMQETDISNDAVITGYV